MKTACKVTDARCGSGCAHVYVEERREDGVLLASMAYTFARNTIMGKTTIDLENVTMGEGEHRRQTKVRIGYAVARRRAVKLLTK
jgi:hypothetical protein